MITPRAEAYRHFFEGLLDDLRETHHFTSAKAAQPNNHYSFKAGLTGVTLGASFAHNRRVRADVYIDQGDERANKRLFDALRLQKDDLERAFGERFEWERLDNRIASRIAVYRDGSIDSDERALSEIRTWLVDRLLRFKKTFAPVLGKDRKV